MYCCIPPFPRRVPNFHCDTYFPEKVTALRVSIQFHLFNWSLDYGKNICIQHPFSKVIQEFNWHCPIQQCHFINSWEKNCIIKFGKCILPAVYSQWSESGMDPEMLLFHKRQQSWIRCLERVQQPKKQLFNVKNFVQTSMVHSKSRPIYMSVWFQTMLQGLNQQQFILCEFS